MRWMVLLVCAGCLVGDGEDETLELASSGGSRPFAIDSVEPGGRIASGLPIARSQAQATPVTYYGITKTLAANDRLHLRAVVPVSKCNPTDLPAGHGAGLGDKGSPCEDMTHRMGTYSYAPTIEARMVWKPTGKVLVGWTGYKCSELIHHCPLVLEADGVASPGKGTGNVVVEVRAYADAGDPWMKGDVVELEGDCKGDNYGSCAGNEITGDEQGANDRDGATQGQMTIVQVPPAGLPHKDYVETTLRTNRIGIFTGYYNKCNVPHPKPQVILQRQIDPTKFANGDILQADVTLQVKDDSGNGSYDFDHFVGTWIILTNGAGDIYPTGPGARWISPMTGKNCGNDPCTKHIGGATRLDSLPTTPMYITVLTEAIQQGANTEGPCTGPNPFKDAFLDVLGGAKHELSIRCFGSGCG